MQLTTQQKTERTITEQEELLKAQLKLIDMLKQEIQQLNDHIAKTQTQSSVEQTSAAEIRFLREELYKMRQNNDSLMMTFEAYKKVFQNTQQQKTLVRIRSDRSLAKDQQTKEPSLFQTLKQRIRMRSDVQNEFPASVEIQNFSKKSDFAQFFVYEFSDPQSKYWQAEIFTPYRQSPKGFPKIKNRLRSAIAKRSFPQQYRHIFWSWLIDNPFALTEKLFYINLERARSKPKVNIIAVDLKRLNVKIEGENAAKMLQQIEECLYAFIELRPDIGYVQGMPYFMWMLLVRMQKFEAFRCFCSLVTKDKVFYSLITFEEDKVHKIMNSFDHLLKQKRPKLHKHLQELKITPDMYLVEWAYTMYCRAFPLSTSSKIWDLWICEGSSVIFRTALSIMEMVESWLLGLEYEDTMVTLKTCTHNLEEGELIRLIRKTKFEFENQFFTQ